MFGKVVIKVLDSTRYQDADTKVLAEKEIEIV
jgi:hypothetical protein